MQLLNSSLNYLLYKIKKIDWLVISSVLVLALVSRTVYTAFLFPIYPDEISERIWLSRLPYDYPYLSSNLPACMSTFLQKMPPSLVLPGLVDWLIHGELSSPFQFRIAGLFFLILFIAIPVIHTLYCQRQHSIGMTKNERLRLVLVITAFICGIFTIGVNPIFLIINRAEQSILLSIIILWVIYVVCEKRIETINTFNKCMLVAGFFIAISLAMHAHGKAFYLAPFYSLVGWRMIRNLKFNYILNVFLMSFGLLIAYDNYHAYRIAYSCPEIPEFEAAMKTFTIDPFLIFSSPIEFFYQSLKSLKDFYRFGVSLSFNAISEVNYLPSSPLKIGAKVSNLSIWLWLLISIPGILILIAKKYFTKQTGCAKTNLGLIVLFACILISAIFNLTKNWYDGPYIYTVLMFIGALFIAENYPSVYSQKRFRKYLIVFALFSMLSQSVFIDRNLKSFKNDFSGLGLKVTNFDKDAVDSTLSSLSKKCQINKNHSNKLVLDDVTYLYFKKSSNPISFTFIFGAPEPFLKNYFSKIDSDGLVVQCSNLGAKDYDGLVAQEGNFCCISKEGLTNLPWKN
jgi:hypothetical protein